MTDVQIRPAHAGDAPAIARIYNHYVATSTATFDIEPKSVEDRVAWLRERDERHPVLVAEAAGVVLGWASLSPYRERPAWAHTAEVAVYLEPSATGHGLGSRLLASLLEAARSSRLHVLVSQVVADNEASIKMAQNAGFESVGIMREVGWKFGTWIDLVVLQHTVTASQGGGTA